MSCVCQILSTEPAPHLIPPAVCSVLTMIIPVVVIVVVWWSSTNVCCRRYKFLLCVAAWPLHIWVASGLAAGNMGRGFGWEWCGQFTTEGIHSLVIKGNWKNKGRLGFPAHHFYTGAPTKRLSANTAVAYSRENSLFSVGAPFQG